MKNFWRDENHRQNVKWIDRMTPVLLSIDPTIRKTNKRCQLTNSKGQIIKVVKGIFSNEQKIEVFKDPRVVRDEYGIARPMDPTVKLVGKTTGRRFKELQKNNQLRVYCRKDKYNADLWLFWDPKYKGLFFLLEDLDLHQGCNHLNKLNAICFDKTHYWCTDTYHIPVPYVKDQKTKLSQLVFTGLLNNKTVYQGGEPGKLWNIYQELQDHYSSRNTFYNSVKYHIRKKGLFKFNLDHSRTIFIYSGETPVDLAVNTKTLNNNIDIYTQTSCIIEDDILMSECNKDNVTAGKPACKTGVTPEQTITTTSSESMKETHEEIMARIRGRHPIKEEQLMKRVRPRSINS